MILASGRTIPNWILQLAFRIFDEHTTMFDLITDIEEIAESDLNETSHSKLSVEDALEVLKKFNDILPDYEDMLDGFFEKHGLGRDEYDGDDDEEGDNGAPDSPEDNALPERFERAESGRRTL